MATHFSVQSIECDGDTLSRHASVRLGTSGNLKFETPLRAGSKGVTDAPLYEIHRRISPDRIRKCLGSEAEGRKLGLELNKKCNGSFNVLTLQYDSKTVVPTKRMVEELSDIQYNHTDVIAIPSWFELVSDKGQAGVDLYLELSDMFLEAASVRNHKPIFGTIPQCISPEGLDKVVNHFIDKDVTSFMVDSHGRTIMSSSWIRTFQRVLFQNHDIEKECVLYTMNAYQGVMRNDVTKSEAKDFIGFTAGFDIIGGKYISKFGSDSKEGPGKGTFGRVFESDSYTYRRQVCSREEKEIINEQTIRDQNSEFEHVRSAIHDSAVVALLETKDLTKETMDTIMSFSDRSRNSSLDDFI